jgi:hypothetical protein
MHRIRNIFILVLGFAAFAYVGQTSAQASGQPDSNTVLLNYATEYRNVLTPMSPVTITQAETRQEGDHLIVSGRVRRMYEVKLPGHIDLMVQNASGKVLAGETARVAGLTSNRRGRLTLPFRFRLALVPPPGSKISLRYHDHSSRDENLECPKSL